MNSQGRLPFPSDVVGENPVVHKARFTQISSWYGSSDAQARHLVVLANPVRGLTLALPPFSPTARQQRGAPLLARRRRCAAAEVVFLLFAQAPSLR